MEDIVLRRAVMVSICERSSEVPECERSLDELERLLSTAGAEASARIIQVKDSYDPRTVIGKGKVLEIAEIIKNHDADLVVFDVDLSPMQIRNLEEDIEGCEVIDRSMLILDIFALHAISGEGKLQVELAQLKYTAPRLIGKGAVLSRQGGGIGTRGPGETKLETDRRHLQKKITSLEEKLRELEHNRSVMRAGRDKSGFKKIAIVGYTNAGKSTLLNLLTSADVLAEDKLFATLDPTTRKLELPTGETVLLTDTVGFIRKLPHHLIKAFKSTLDEVKYADLLLIVSDINDPEAPEHLKVTEDIISELGAEDKMRIYVMNKADSQENPSYGEIKENHVVISARENQGIDELLNVISRNLNASKCEKLLLIPYECQVKINYLYENQTVIKIDYTDEGILVLASLDSQGVGMFSKYFKE